MNNVDNYKDFKKYLLLQLKNLNINDMIFVVQVHSVNIVYDSCILTQLYHYKNKLKRDYKIRDKEIVELLRDFNVLFTSDNLKECIDQINLLKTIEKYNI